MIFWNDCSNIAKKWHICQDFFKKPEKQIDFFDRKDYNGAKV